MQHPHIPTLERIYAAFAKGDWNAVAETCSEKMTFQVPGKSRLAGKYTRENFASAYATQLSELSGQTFALEVHDILASDRHATVLATARLMRAGKPIEFRTVHVWRFEDAKPVAWYEYPRDLYQFDAVWS